MRTSFYGHACLKVETGQGQSVLMDPWFSPQGAFFGSWFPFPENTPLLDAALAQVTDICVSHNHADHLDPAVLTRACAENSALTLHVPQYHTRWFERRLARLLPGLMPRLAVHGAYERFQVAGNLSMFFVPEESPGAFDAAMVCLGQGQSVVNLNDSRLSAAQLLQIRQITQEVDLLALQASGASEYPVNYTYTADEYQQRCVQKRRAKLEHCQEIIDLLQPRQVVFFAGPPAFLDPALAALNAQSATSVFPDQLAIVQDMARARPDIAAKTLFLLPGDTVQDTWLWPHTDLASPRLAPYTQKAAYLAAYATRRADLPPFDWGEPPEADVLQAYFQRMATLSDYVSACIAGAITFVIRGRTTEAIFTVDFAQRRVQPGLVPQPFYVLTAPASAVRHVLDGTATWDDVFLSLRMTFDERTERFIAHFKPLLRYMDAEVLTHLERYEKQLRGEEVTDVPMFDVSYRGASYRIQRHCPHAGSDLAYHGRINQEEGTITCLAHRFCFDIQTGACTNARGYQLHVGAGAPGQAEATPTAHPAP